MTAKPSFFAELQRRHVYKVGAAYCVAGWLLVQIVTQVFPIYDVSAHVQRIIVGLIIAGLPVALVLAWLFDLTPQGIVRTADAQSGREAPSAAERRRSMDRKLNYALGSLLVLAVATLGAQRAGWLGASGAAPAGANDKSIAVLPFENLSDDKANAYFAEGIQDEILTRLAKIHALKVISRTSTMQYASRPENLSAIGHDLGVANILEGSVQKIGDAVHINVQLIRAATDDHLWADSYDRKLDNIFGVEGEVAQTIAGTLQATLTGDEQQQLAVKPTSNPQAYEAYLRGLANTIRADAFRDKTLTAIGNLEEAVRLDPGFAAAWALLSRQHAFAYWNFDQSVAHRNAAHDALERSMALAPDTLETLKAQGFYHYWIERDYPTAIGVFQHIRALSPSDDVASYALAAIARRQGRWSDSLALWAQALDLDPRNAQSYLDAASTAESMRDTQAADRILDRGLSFFPDSSGLLSIRVLVLQQLGQFEQAQRILDRAHIRVGDDNLVSSVASIAILLRQYPSAISFVQAQLQHAELPMSSRGYYQLYLGDLYRHSGDAVRAHQSYEDAKQSLESELETQPDNPNLIVSLSQVEAGLGNRDQAYERARRAIELLPTSRDHYVGPYFEEVLARLQARFGDREAAISGIRHLLQTSYGDPPLTPALLKADPDFDNLRDDPDFQRLLVEANASTPAQ